jgi:ABC-type multidrug transport system ATPase subunit
VSFVPQTDILLSLCTVREAVYHAARVRLPRAWTDRQVGQLVDALLRALGIFRVRHSLLGDGVLSRGVSGGERRRVALAVALAAAPSLVVGDEITSGLDAAAALQVARLMQKVAALGTTVLLVLHQPRPEIFEIVQSVILFDAGRILFHGPRTDIPAFLNTVLPDLDESVKNRASLADTVIDLGQSLSEIRSIRRGGGGGTN